MVVELIFAVILLFKPFPVGGIVWLNQDLLRKKTRLLAKAILFFLNEGEALRCQR